MEAFVKYKMHHKNRTKFDELMMGVYIKVTGRGKHRIVAVCDANLLGKTLKFGKIRFEVRREFYEGSLVHVKEAIKLMRNAPNINLVGSLIVDEALKEGLVHPQAILDIVGIPHAQIIRI